MRVVSLEMREFRTYARAEAQLGAGLTVVYGPNGAGKSNLLEALYFGCTGRSSRTRNERELVRFGASTTRVAVACSEGSERHRLSVGFEVAGEDGRAIKRMSYDGAPVQRLVDVQERPLVSLFEPDRLELVKGRPAARRAHLDQVVAAIWPLRANDRREYMRVLAQRNALLTRLRAGDASPQTLSTWDRELAAIALALREHRAAAAARLAEPFAERAAQLGCAGDLRLEYRPRSHARDEEEFVAELQTRRELDVRRGYSSHGPHRDELAILRDGRELRVYGSQGEQRLGLLALLLAERAVIARERGRVPLMLLDDVMSELDSQRREMLADELAAAGQSVIATTDLAHVPGSADEPVTRLRVSPGAVLQEAVAA